MGTPEVEPGEAYLVLHDGERVECLIEKLGPNLWQAVPVRDVAVEEVDQAYVDVVPGNSSVDFLIGGTPQ